LIYVLELEIAQKQADFVYLHSYTWYLYE